MSAPTTDLELAVADHIETFPAPDGVQWCVVTYEQYEKACAGGLLPTLHIEYCDGDDVTMHYLVGQHDLAPEVTP